VFPTAIAVLRQKVVDYATLTRVHSRDPRLLFGILTFSPGNAADAIARRRLPDLEDKTLATDEQFERLGDLVNEDSLLWFRDIRDGGAVGHLCGGGPFSVDTDGATETF